MSQKKDDIENFFDRHLNKGSFEFDEAQWLALEQRLDAAAFESPGDLPNSVSLNTIVYLGLGLAVILFVFFGLKLDSEHTRKKLVQQKEVIDSLQQKIQLAENQKATFANKASDQNGTIAEKATSTQGNIQAKNDYVPRQIATLSSSDESSLTEQRTGSGHENSTANAPTQSVEEKKVYPTEEVDKVNEGKEVDTNKIGMNPIQPENEGIADGRYQLLSLDRLNVAIVEAPVAYFLAGPIIFDSKTTDVDAAEKSKDGNEWSVAIFVAPDFNSTSLAELYTSLGQAVGVSGSYVMRNKWRLSVGATLNTKNYEAGQGEYSARPGFWTNGVKPESVDASCLALDVPITIGYNLLQGNGSDIFINGGLSTYWMITEEYIYNYEVPVDGLVWSWKGKRENFHWFGSANVSILYLRRVSNRFSIMLEPYFKSPLKGIGEGSVSLLSSGINVGAVYRFGSKKNKPPDINN